MSSLSLADRAALPVTCFADGAGRQFPILDSADIQAAIRHEAELTDPREREAFRARVMALAAALLPGDDLAEPDPATFHAHEPTSRAVAESRTVRLLALTERGRNALNHRHANAGA